MYVKKGAAARRFQKEHRCQLWQSDVKYGPYAAGRKGERKRQIYLVVWIDDATRFLVAAKFYMNQDIGALEDSLRTAVQKYGAPDSVYVDNGPAYRSGWLKTTLSKIGTRYLSARPFHPEGKGKVESFNKRVGKFLSDAALKKFETLAEYNEYLGIWAEEYYHKTAHSGLGAISPGTAFAADNRPLRFVPEEKLRDAFLHTETRKVDKADTALYLADSKLTPRWFYKGLLDQLGIEAKFYRGDAKRQLHKQLAIIRDIHHRKVVVIVDEAHLLDRETLEEIRFVLNTDMDSMNPMGLILVGQPELWDKLRMQTYAAIRGRIDLKCELAGMDRSELDGYVNAHLAYSGIQNEIFTDAALDELLRCSAGSARAVNKAATHCLMYAAQRNKKLIDDGMVKTVVEAELP
jgi:type II secretory pathway predicted ATPase ExeA